MVCICRISYYPGHNFGALRMWGEGGLGGLENRAGSRSFTVIRTLFAAIRTLFAHYSQLIRTLFAIIRD